MFNAHHDPLTFRLPETKWGLEWAAILNTAEETDHLSEEHFGVEVDAGGELEVAPWSLVLLKRIEPQ
jgi:glycogen operon protein